MEQSDYSLSYTSGAALLPESILVAKLAIQIGNWSKVRRHVLENNTLQARTESTLERLYREVSGRLKCLKAPELAILADGTEQEQRQIAWLASCRRYRFIHDFAIEVLDDHYKIAKYHLDTEDFDVFFNAKAEWNSILDQASPERKGKAKQVLYRMMRECGLINQQQEIAPQTLSPRLLEILRSEGNHEERIFPGATV